MFSICISVKKCHSIIAGQIEGEKRGQKLNFLCAFVTHSGINTLRNPGLQSQKPCLKLHFGMAQELETRGMSEGNSE